MIKTRIAPTPSGYLHQGNAYNFILTWLLAKASDGQVGLRIDDMDATRSRPAYIEDIFRTLDWLGISPDFGPSGPTDFAANHSQQLKLADYRQALNLLLARGKGYACTCSRAQIKAASTDHRYPGTCRPAMRQRVAGREFAIRAALHAEAEAISLTTDQEHYVIDLRAQLGDFVLWRKDDLPAYQLVSVLEDERMGINLLVRGQDLLHSSAAQYWLATQLGYRQFRQVRFRHHSLLSGADGAKLSKSAGATSLHAMREAGSPTGLFRAFAEWQNITCPNINTLQDLLDCYRQQQG